MSEITSGYLELTKPKVTLLNLFVGVTCFVLAEFSSLNWSALIAFSAVGYLAAGGCGAVNCYFDRDLDGVMSRTSKRVVPSGVVSPVKALLFGTLLISLGLFLAGVIFGPLTLLMVLLGIFFYLPVYTVWLKRRSPWNVVIGGIAGSFAALAGWVATGSPLTLTPLLVGLLDFLWTPAHLWALAVRRAGDYAKAHIPMLPVTGGASKAAKYIFLFNVATFASSLMFLATGFTGFVFPLIAVFAGAVLLWESHVLTKNPSEKQGLRVFKLSLPYLFSVMLALVVDRLVSAVITV